MLLQPLVTNDVEHRAPDGHRHRVTPERIEVLHPIGECGRDGWSGNHSSDGMAISDRLTQGDDVGNDALGFKSPHVAPGPPEADLNLVGDANATGGAYPPVHLPEISRRQNDLAGAREHG